MREAKPGQGKANLAADLKENHPQAETIYYILPVNNVNPFIRWLLRWGPTSSHSEQRS